MTNPKGTLNNEQLEEFRRIYGSTGNRDLCEIFGITLHYVKELAKTYALAKDKRRFQGNPMPRWTEAELELMCELYPDTSNQEIAHRLGRSLKAVVTKAHHMKLHKTPEYLRNMGLTNCALRKDRQK